MIFLITEDNKKAFPYGLLTPLFNEDIQCTRGCGNIPGTLRYYRNRTTIAFVDLLPDNYRTQRSFNDAVRYSYNYDNVFVIPIPGIEYYFIKTFIGKVTTEATIALEFGNYKECKFSDRKLRLITRNYEQFCKSVIDRYNECFNKHVFEKNNCLCASEHINVDCTELLLSEKQNMFLKSLPYTSNEPELLQFLRKEYMNNMILYSEMLTKFIEYGIVTNTETLLIPKWISGK